MSKSQPIKINRKDFVERFVLKYEKLRDCINTFERKSRSRELTQNEMIETAGEIATLLFVLIVDNNSFLKHLDLKKFFFIAETKMKSDLPSYKINELTIQESENLKTDVALLSNYSNLCNLVDGKIIPKGYNTTFTRPVSVKEYLKRKIISGKKPLSRDELIRYFRNKHGAHVDSDIPFVFNPEKFTVTKFNFDKEFTNYDPQSTRTEKAQVLECATIQMGYEFIKSFHYHLANGNLDFLKTIISK